MKITILVDNRAGDGLVGEHGLSLWIEAEDNRILFDTGQGPALSENARKIGVDLAKADALVLSHGHYDHTGGVADVLKLAGSIDVYCHPGVVHPRYAIRNGKPKAIQMPPESMEAFGRLSWKQLHWVQKPLFLSDHIGITGPIPRNTDYEDAGGPFYLDPEGKAKDPIDDDLAIWIRTKAGLVICVGCSHAGIVNTLNHVRRINGNLPIRAVIGGFHLLEATKQRIERTLGALQSMSPALLSPCHCTGDGAVEALRNTFGDQVVSCASGMTLQF